MANTVSIHVQSFDETNNGFSKVSESLGKSMKSLIGIAAMAGPAMSAPIIAGAGASAAALASVGAAVGAFGLAVSPQIKKITDLKANLNTMSPAVKTAAVQFRGLTEDLNAWSESLAPQTMPVFTKGLQAMREVLPQLTPLVETAAGSLTKFMDGILKGVKGGGFRSFISDLDKSARTTLPAFLNSLKNIAVGFGGIIRAFLPFSGAMTGGLEKITAKFREFGQSLKGSKGFNDFMAGVQAVVPGIIKLFGNLAESVKKIALAFAPVSGVMLGVVEAFGMFFASIDQDKLDFIVPMVAAIVVGMKAWAFVTGLVTAAQGALTAAMGINPWTGTILAVTALAVALYSTNDASEQAALGLDKVAGAADTSKTRMMDAAKGIGSALLDTIKWVDTLGGLMPNLSGEAKKAADQFGDFAEGADFASTSAGDFGESTDGASDSAARAAAKVGVFTDALKTLANQQLEQSGSLIGLEAAFDDATESVKKNGRNLDINTEKGRNNRTALNNIASSALKVRDKMTEAGASARSVGGRMEAARNNFIHVARQMGLSATAARRLADRLGLIKSKTVVIWTKYKTTYTNAGITHGTGDAALATKATGGVVGYYGHAAGGGPRSNMTWVGEQGPELVDLAPGSMVHSAGDSRRMAAGMGGGSQQPIVVQLVLDGKTLAEALIDPLKGSIRSRAGSGTNSVQRALS